MPLVCASTVTRKFTPPISSSPSTCVFQFMRYCFALKPLFLLFFLFALQQPQVFGTCPIHPSLTVEFFSPVCQGPVCVHCKMIGNYSTGEAASHKLIAIGDAYRGALSGADKVRIINSGGKSEGVLIFGFPG